MYVIKNNYMNKYNSQIIKDTLLSLRTVKTKAFINQGDDTNFKDIVEICRIIDVAMLPMFYIWEHYCHKNLSEIEMEQHLKMPYERFSRTPRTNTWTFYLFLKTCNTSTIPTGVKKKILLIYELFINIK